MKKFIAGISDRALDVSWGNYRALAQSFGEKILLYEHKKGYKGKAIAHHLGIGKSTVFRYLRSPVFPERKGRSDKGCGKVSPYQKYLLEQWNSGCHDTKKLYAEIKEQGYQGSYVTLARYTLCIHLETNRTFQPVTLSYRAAILIVELFISFPSSICTIRSATSKIRLS